MSTMSTEYRKLPSVDQLLAQEAAQNLAASFPQTFIVNLIRHELDAARAAIATGSKAPSIEEILSRLAGRAAEFAQPRLRRVINATGVILHTNLGRAPMSKEAIRAVETVTAGYSNLEFDIDSGGRGSRQAHIERLLCEVTGAEAGIVVNNNAAAVLLALSAHARRREVIVSRGQAVEIGDSFRIPDVMRQSGAKLVEVGTTNCTYARDYENAITTATAALLRVHTSNFRVIGFTNEVGIREMAEAGARHSLPVFDDQGSGCLLDTAKFGLSGEPLVQDSVAAGAALVCFSGDKLVGGPQAGIIVGKKEYVDKLRRHPLARAVRIDKARLAGLIATLTHYLKGEALEKVPVWKMISATEIEMGRRASAWAEACRGKGHVIDGESMVGGGSLPGGVLLTKVLVIGSSGRKDAGAVLKLASDLRAWTTPIIGRVQDNMLLLDPRTVLPEEDRIVVRALGKLLGGN